MAEVDKSVDACDCLDIQKAVYSVAEWMPKN